MLVCARRLPRWWIICSEKLETASVLIEFGNLGIDVEYCVVSAGTDRDGNLFIMDGAGSRPPRIF